MGVSLVPEAHDSAERAAAESGVVIDLARSAADEAEISRVFDDVWPSQEGPHITSNLLHALVHAGAYASLARDVASGEVVGATLGFPGRDADVPGGVFLHSHMSGVREGLRDRRIGTAMKRHQRWWALSEGIPVVAWTFDPLVRRNAYLNVVRLGVRVRDYHRDFYGEMADAINGGDRTDRVLAWWEVGSERAVAAAAGQLKPVDHDRLSALVSADDAGEPVSGPSAVSGQMCVIELPEDIVAIRRADPERAMRWRLAVREAFGQAHDADLCVRDVTSQGAYVLSPKEDR